MCPPPPSQRRGGVRPPGGAWRKGHSRVAELQGEPPLRFLLVALRQEAQELGFEDGLQEAVVFLLVEDKQVVLQGAGKGNGGQPKFRAALPRKEDSTQTSGSVSSFCRSLCELHQSDKWRGYKSHP